MARKASSKTADSTAIRGSEADFGPEHADTFRRDLEMANAEVRNTNRSRLPSIFELNPSNLATALPGQLI